MSLFGWITAAVVVAASTSVAAVWGLIRARNMERWLGAYVRRIVRPPESSRLLESGAPLDLFIAVCDHFEPECYHASRDEARERVRRWVTEYPRVLGGFRDSRGRAPQHTFFFPQDEYRPEYLDALKTLCDAGYGDVDVHLHHEGDTAEQLRDRLNEFRATLYERHGLLRKDPVTGEVVYGFIHGNWALCNSRPDGYCCGVDQELSVLLETGCYADFTYPSAPSPTQPPLINSIYYAQDIPGRRKSHEVGVLARVGQPAPANHLLMIQGPLGLDWRQRKLGLIPRIENADLTGGRAPSLRRLRLWLEAGVHVAGRPDWLFVKLHTHGCKDSNIGALLGGEMRQFHGELAAFAARQPELRYHYVTAREMAQLVHAAEDGRTIADVLDRPRLQTNLADSRGAAICHGDKVLS